MRFCPVPRANAVAQRPPRHNNFAAWPPMRGLGRYYELTVRCAGEADPVTGYFINIKQIDQAFAGHVLPLIEERLARSIASGAMGEDIPLGHLLRDMFAALQQALAGTVRQIQLRLTPRLAIELGSEHMNEVLIRNRYEFSAAHRLHVPTLSEEENRKLFGKCNNPAGHGHNYEVEVAVRVPIREDGQVLNIEQLDALVDEAAIEKLDHKHLNMDVPQFRSLNPSVENIAKVVHSMLRDPLRDIGAQLEEISIWETGKTMCTYKG